MQTIRVTSALRNEIEKIVDERISEIQITKSDFTELKETVQELAQAQQRTEIKVEKLSDTVQELTQAQQRTEIKVEKLSDTVQELTQAQQRTEEELRKLTIIVGDTRKELVNLAAGLKETRQDLGGLSRSVSYGFENEVYRILPLFLKSNYGIEIKEKFIRKVINGSEINILGKGTKDGKEVIVVGEVKLRLDYKVKRDGQKDEFDELEEKSVIVKNEYKTEQVIKIFVTHLASDEFIRKAKEKGIIVIQSFEL